MTLDAIKTREETARFVEQQFDVNYKCKLNKGDCQGYGRQDVRELMDFIYGGEPTTDEQQVNGNCGWAPKS